MFCKFEYKRKKKSLKERNIYDYCDQFFTTQK